MLFVAAKCHVLFLQLLNGMQGIDRACVITTLLIRPHNTRDNVQRKVAGSTEQAVMMVLWLQPAICFLEGELKDE